ncbi:hypothetical protein B4133_0345 [Bacillus altitudinis]|nr:hypothetical protein B4133_0345 [Bacillus altitudinis]PYH24521.1 hypothetical protein US8_01235 [Bacillus altitudinis]
MKKMFDIRECTYTEIFVVKKGKIVLLDNKLDSCAIRII